MTNIEALKATTKRICNVFYADDDVMLLTMSQNGINPDADYDVSGDGADMLRCAIRIVRSFVETSRSENGISVSIDREAVERNIKRECKDAGIEYEDEDADEKSVEDISSMW